MSGYDGGLKNICVQVGVLRSDKNVFIFCMKYALCK